LNLLLERLPLIHLRAKRETTGVHLQTGVKYLQRTRVFQGGNLVRPGQAEHQWPRFNITATGETETQSIQEP
jgi:hypothetical protein